MFEKLFKIFEFRALNLPAPYRVRLGRTLVSGFRISNFEFRACLRSGFSLVEMLSVVAVLGVISSLTFGAFLDLNKNEALRKEKTSVQSVLAKARSLTLASKEAKEYGVHLESGQVVIFKGSTYSANDASNTPITLNKLVAISGANLSGGGSDVVFERLTGETQKDGSITLSLVSDSAASTTITLHRTGLAE